MSKEKVSNKVPYDYHQHRICHDYNFMISDFIRVHSVIVRATISDTCPNGCYQGSISAEDNILSRRARSTFSIFPRKGRIAWLARSRPVLLNHQPITFDQKQFDLRIFFWQSASLRQACCIKNTFAPGQLARFRAASIAAASALETIFLASAGCSSNH